MDLDNTTQQGRHKFYQSKEWRQLRNELLREGNVECIRCKELGLVTTKAKAILEVHHVIYLEDSKELALDKDNLIVLCKTHHNEVHKRFEFDPNNKRNKWEHDEIW